MLSLPLYCYYSSRRCKFKARDAEVLLSTSSSIIFSFLLRFCAMHRARMLAQSEPLVRVGEEELLSFSYIIIIIEMVTANITITCHISATTTTTLMLSKSKPKIGIWVQVSLLLSWSSSSSASASSSA